MVSHRLYCVDGSGKISLADDINVTDDAPAIEAARKTHRGALKCEIWQRNRLVATLNAHDLAD